VKTKEAEAYIRKIRNPFKRAYAVDYWRWLQTCEGDAPAYNPAELSYMGAQAVRINLDGFVFDGSTDETGQGS
jgi:hypothetical protein